MANSLNIDLTGKVVILRPKFFAPGLVATEQPFLCGGGFGALAYTNGRMLAGTFLSDGEETAVSGYDVYRLATQDEIDACPADILASAKLVGRTAVASIENGELQGGDTQ